MRAQHSNTHSYATWNVGIQFNGIDNNKNANLQARMQLVQCRERPEETRLGLQVLIHALKNRFRKAMPIKYILPIFSYAFTQNSSSFLCHNYFK